MAYDANNIFAKILRGEIPCQRVYEDGQVLAFHDINPKAPRYESYPTRASTLPYTFQSRVKPMQRRRTLPRHTTYNFPPTSTLSTIGTIPNGYKI